MFTSLGVLVQLGLSGVGEPIGLTGQLVSLIQLPRSNGIGVVGMGVDWARRVFVSIHGLSQSFLTDALPRLGPVALATQSVLLVSASTTYQAPFALGVATSVRCVRFLFLSVLR